MNFKYKAITDKGEQREGEIDAQSKELAVTALQRRGFIVTMIRGEDDNKMFSFGFSEHVAMKDIVIMSRQIATLFDAQVSALKAFSLLAGNAENKALSKRLNQVADDLQAGYSISGALARHPDVFSEFYVNMVRAGEESGKLNQTFIYLAEYLDRQYALTSKTRNALIYPAFVVFTFFAVMGLMLTMVIPKLSLLIEESGQVIPLYTKVVIGVSHLLVSYGWVFILAFIIIVAYMIYLSRTESGKRYLDALKIEVPIVGSLFKKLYFSRIADNLDTMISSGIPIVHAIEITGTVVGNKVYADILAGAAEAVKGGSSLSNALGKNPLMPSILVQMVKVGEETGSLGKILGTLAKFYKREVDDAVDTLVGLIEPIMIVMLGLGVGVLLASVLVPIYNIASGIN